MFKSQKSGLMKRIKAKGGEPTTERVLKAEVHTEAYVLRGVIRTRHERLKDVLENWFHPFLPLEGTVLLHQDPSGKPIQEEMRRVMVRLGEILIAMPDEDIPLGDRSHHPEFVPKYPVPALIRVGRMEIEGKIFIRQEEEAELGIISSREPFIAVREAKVSYPHHEHIPPFTSQVVLVNRDRIQLIRRI